MKSTTKLNQHGSGWIELPNGQRLNPAPHINVYASRPGCALRRWIMSVIGGCYGR